MCVCAHAKPCLCVYFCRCVAICSLGLWVCEELGQQKIHHQVNDAINVLGVTLKVSVFPVVHSPPMWCFMGVLVGLGDKTVSVHIYR